MSTSPVRQRAANMQGNRRFANYKRRDKTVWKQQRVFSVRHER